MRLDKPLFSMPKDQALDWDLLKVAARSGRMALPVDTTSGNSFFWARNALYHGLVALGLGTSDHVLVPAFICSAAVSPILAVGAEVGYYRMRSDCTPDVADLSRKIKAKTRAIMTVHYFGFPQNVQLFRELCNRHGLILIEDCAHVLSGQIGGQPLGTFGDVSIFSWRKFLPLYDGADLIVKMLPARLTLQWSEESWLFSLKVVKNLLDRRLDQTSGALPRLLYRCLQLPQRTLSRRGETSTETSSMMNADSNQLAFDRKTVNWPMSRASRWIMTHSDIPAIIQRRRSNYFALLDELSKIAGVTPLFPFLPPDVCPWVFPLFLDGLRNAHLLLREKRIPAVTWGGVRDPEITKELFPDADYLYENLVFLPIHQNLGAKDLKEIVEKVKEVRKNRPVCCT
jgi:perosamine synthetase